MWLGCIVFSLIVLPIGFLHRFLPVPEVCCIPALAGGRPKDFNSEDVDHVDHVVVAEAGLGNVVMNETPSYNVTAPAVAAPTTPAVNSRQCYGFELQFTLSS